MIMAQEPTTPPEDGMAKQRVNPSIPELKEYAQVAECPYTTPIITFKVNDSYYNIPQNYLRPFDSLQFDPQSVHAFFSGKGWHHELNVHPEVAHTFVHYLYTGQYETLETQFEPPQSVDDIPARTKARDSIEFERAAYVYEAAVQYEIPGLLNMAQVFMARFAERLPIANILRGIRCVYGNLLEQSSGCMWLEDFVREQLSIAFIITDRKLRQIIKEYEVGNSRSFDHFVVDEVLALYEKEQDKIYHVKRVGNSRGEHEPMIQSEPPCEPAPEPEIKAPEIPDSPLYFNWHTLSSKDRKKREKTLIKNGLPIPGKDFELPVPNAEFPKEPELEPKLEPHRESVSEPPCESPYEPEPELELEPEIKTLEIPDSPLYFNWHTLSSKDRKKREKSLIKSGLPIPGKDFELPVPNDEPPPETEPELPAEPEPEPEPVPMSSSSFGSWDMPVASDR
ncbi:hypothetical protein AnigIFM62618_009155 [Aspergillus niger]|nr:hypothetical protein AnigIFM62618_009155 [Aspergillus niger]